jgi:dual specificity protein kinase YAK1
MKGSPTLTCFELASRPNAPQLPPIQPSIASAYHPQAIPLTLSPYRDMSVSSPRQPVPMTPVPKGPVPRFVKCHSLSELQPRLNDQPPFRRANPDGGFLSVSLCKVKPGNVC